MDENSFPLGQTEKKNNGQYLCVILISSEPKMVILESKLTLQTLNKIYSCGDCHRSLIFVDQLMIKYIIMNDEWIE